MSIKLKKEVMLTIGMVSLSISLLLDRFAGKEPLVDFFCGLFTGLSITLNITFLIKYKYEMNKEKNN